MRATSLEHLQTLIAHAIAKDGYQASLNHIDVSGIDDMRALFFHKDIVDG